MLIYYIGGDFMKKILTIISIIFITLLLNANQANAKTVSGSLNLYNESQQQLIKLDKDKALKFQFQGGSATYSVVLKDKYDRIIAKALTTKTNHEQSLFTVGLKKGDYTLKVSLADRNEYTHNFQLSYSTVKGNYEQEYNDTFTDANKLPFNQLYKGSADLIDPFTSSGADYFTFKLSKDRAVKLTLSKSNLATLTAYIVNSAGEDIENRIISANNKTLSTNSTISLKKGTYYIRITSTQQNTPYALKISQSNIVNTEIEQNNIVQQANQVASKKTITGHIFSSSDLDYFKFTLKKKKTVSFFYALAQYQQLNATLMNQNNKIFDDSTYVAEKSTLTRHKKLTLPVGTYYLKLSNNTLKYNLMQYQLKILY